MAYFGYFWCSDFVCMFDVCVCECVGIVSE